MTASLLSGGYAIQAGAAGQLRLISLVANSKNAGALWVQVHDKASALAGTEVPRISIPVAANSQITPIYMGEEGLPFTLGIQIGLSSTQATFTAATADLLFAACVRAY